MNQECLPYTKGTLEHRKLSEWLIILTIFSINQRGEIIIVVSKENHVHSSCIKTFKNLNETKNINLKKN